MGRKKNKVKLGTDDWNELFPGEFYKIATTELTIEPLALRPLNKILKKLGSVMEQLPQISVDDMMSGTGNAQVLKFISAVIAELPDVLSEMSGLDEEDVLDLPLVQSVDLFVKCIEVNLAAKDSLLKNLKKLGEGISQINQDGMTKKQDPLKADLKLAVASGT